MPTYAAICLALGITVYLYSFKAIYDHWTLPAQTPDRPWPYVKVSGVISGALMAAGLIGWLT